MKALSCVPHVGWATVRIGLIIAPLLLSGVVSAQSGGTINSSPFDSSPLSSGNVTLTVQVMADDHKFLDIPAFIRVRSLNLDRGEKWATTRQRTDISISGLNEGQYEVEVSALGFKTQTTRVDLYGRGWQAVQVILKKDINTDTYAAPMKDVSKKARQAAERGLISLQLGNLNDAEKNFRAAVKEAPQNAQVNYLLGVVLIQKKHSDEAEKLFLQAIELDPRHVPALTAMGGLRLQQKNYEGAADFLQRATAAGAREWRPHWLLANTRLMQQDYQAALTEAQQAVQLSNNAAPMATLVLGEALANLGRTDEATEVLQRFLQQAPTNPNAADARQMLAMLKEGSMAGVAAQPVVLNVSGLQAHSSPALALMSPAWAPPGVDDVLPPVASGVACPLGHVLDGTGKAILELADNLDRFSATETQLHELLDMLGKPTLRQTRKNDYLSTLSQPRPGFLQLNEYRRNLNGLGGFSDGIVTEGMLGLAFIFHPALRDNYQMDCEGLGEWNGEPAWLVHFRQRPDRPRRVQGFRAGAKNHEVALKGRAWIGAASFQIIRMEAELVEPMRDAQLLQEHQIGNYGPVDFGSKKTQLWLPTETEVYLEYRGRRFRISGHFENFQLFSVDSTQKDKIPDKANNYASPVQ